MDAKVHLAVSYDTEHTLPAQIPSHIINEKDYGKLGREEQKKAWADYTSGQVWADPGLLERSRSELDAISRLGDLFASRGGLCTSFILGRWLDYIVERLDSGMIRDSFRRPGIEIQSHSYDHLTFKTTGDALRDKMSPRVTPSEVDGQLRRANEVIERHLDVRPTGLRTPMGNIAPFDNDDRHVLEALRNNGLRFVSSWLKKEPRVPNRPAEVQPFFYGKAGYDDILEIPGHGYYDVHFTQPTRMLVFDQDSIGTVTEIKDHYIGLLEEALRLAEKRPLPMVVSLVCHPWAVEFYDPKLEATTAVLDFCQKNGISISGYQEVASIFRH